MADEQPDRTTYQTPFALSMLVCDHVHTDPATGKQTILGCFSSIGSTAFPTLHPSLTVFSEITDGLGEVPLTVRLVDVDEEHELVRADGMIILASPLAIGTLVITMRGAIFPAPGEYRLQLLCGDQTLAERRLLLMDLTQGDDDGRTGTDG